MKFRCAAEPRDQGAGSGVIPSPHCTDSAPVLWISCPRCAGDGGITVTIEEDLNAMKGGHARPDMWEVESYVTCPDCAGEGWLLAPSVCSVCGWMVEGGEEPWKCQCGAYGTYEQIREEG